MDVDQNQQVATYTKTRVSLTTHVHESRTAIKMSFSPEK